ncbi:MAG TPA: hypothetical protein VNG89_04270, partial [Vicinamibacterales bacterium]|nr:hypothetical protein [Vicinamibacterales bacterium]
IVVLRVDDRGAGALSGQKQLSSAVGLPLNFASVSACASAHTKCLTLPPFAATAKRQRERDGRETRRMARLV